MANLQIKGEAKEGLLWCKWVGARFRRNKNILGATTGPTGSGKSYQDLRKAELWYEYKFKKPFPPENICFNIEQLIQRLPKVKKRELLIFEESGAGMGSLDFQNKIAKTFGYVLQSFRSMNVGILFNLPYLSMLNKTARLLLHYHFVTYGIDPNTKKAKCKPFFVQVNQKTGKAYEKYLRCRINNKSKTIKRLSWSLPSEELRNAYEKKKEEFLKALTEDFQKDIDKIKKGKNYINPRKKLMNYCWHKLGLRNPVEIYKKVEEIQGYKIHQASLSRDMSAMHREFPKWTKNPKILGYPG